MKSNSKIIKQLNNPIFLYGLEYTQYSYLRYPSSDTHELTVKEGGKIGFDEVVELYRLCVLVYTIAYGYKFTSWPRHNI